MRRRKESGFALLLVFLMAAAIAISLYMEIPRIAFEAQRQKEQLLVDRGEQYKRAIQMFMKANNRWPATIEELESFNNRRFLRKRFIDPMTGQEKWRLIHVQNGILTDSLVKKQNQSPAQTGSTSGLVGEIPVSAGDLSPNGGQAGPNAALRRRASDGNAPGGSGNIAVQVGDPNNPNNPNNPSNTTNYPPGQAPPGTQQLPGQTYPPGTVPQPGMPGVPGIPGQPTDPGQTGQIQQPGQTTQYPGQTQQFPGQPVQYPGQTQQFPGQQIQNPGQTQQYPGQPVQYPGQTQQYPGQTQQYPGQPAQYPGQTQQYPGQPTQYPGQTQQQYPGQTQYPPGLPGSPVNSQAGPPFGQPGMTPGQGPNTAAQMIQQILTSPRPGGMPAPSAAQGTIGGGIAGVASNADAEGIMVINERTNYKEWEFVFDPAKVKPVPNPLAASPGTSASQLGTPASQLGNMPGQQIGTPASQLGNMPGQSAPPQGTPPGPGATPGTNPITGH